MKLGFLKSLKYLRALKSQKRVCVSDETYFLLIVRLFCRNMKTNVKKYYIRKSGQLKCLSFEGIRHCRSKNARPKPKSYRMT